jgi:polyhydroxyalkanoate synthesis repressor PhaR
MVKKIIIKKYENRRLYNVTHSRYVNLDEIARAIQDGCDVQVLDASSGEDLTRLVLSQIIVESAKGPDSVFPLDLLREMVVASGKASQESALNYMRAVTDLYKDTMRGIPQTMNPFEIMQKMVNPAGAAQEAQSSPVAEPGGKSKPSASKKRESKEDSELQELKRSVRKLEDLVSKNKKASSPKKKKARTRAKP